MKTFKELFLLNEKELQKELEKCFGELDLREPKTDKDILLQEWKYNQDDSYELEQIEKQIKKLYPKLFKNLKNNKKIKIGYKEKE